MPDPFAEEQGPWWRYLWRKDRKTYAPKPVVYVLGALGGFIGLALPHPHHDAAAIAGLVGALAAVPVALVERWYKRRHRREEEQLFVLPEARTAPTVTTARSRFE
jgi:hypothetical protein